MELWIYTLQNASQMTPELLSFVPFAIGMWELGTDTVKKAVHVLECYMVLDPLSVLQSYASQMLNAVGRLMAGMTVSASNSILKLVDVMLQSCYSAQCVPPMIHALAQEGVFALLINGIAGDDIGPIRNGYAMIVCRLCMYEPVLTLRAVEGCGVAVEQMIQQLLDRFDSLAQTKQRKLCALGTASLVGTGLPQVLSQIHGLIAVFTSVGAELHSLTRSE
jgi:hypothetical protein